MKLIFSILPFLLLNADSGLMAQANRFRLGLPLGHTDYVLSAVFSPGEKYVVTASMDKTARLWNVENGKLIFNFEGHNGNITSVDFSPDGKWVLTGSSDYTAKIWDANSGMLLHTLTGHRKDIHTVLFSPDGKEVLTSSWDGTTKIWDAGSGTLNYNMESNYGSIRSAAYSPDGKSVITALVEPVAQVWNAKNGKLLQQLQGHSGQVVSASFSPDGKKALTASFDSTAKIWDVKSGRLLLSLKGHSDNVHGAIFSPDGKLVLTISWDKTAKIWDATSGKLLMNFPASSDIESAIFNKSGSKIFIGNRDATIQICNLENGKVERTLLGHNKSIYSVALSRDEKKILTGSADNTAKIWNLENGKILRSFEGHSSRISSAIYDPSGNRVLTASYGKSANLFDIKSGKMLRSFEGHTDWVNTILYSHDGNFVFTGSRDRTSKIWDANSGLLIRTLDNTNEWVYTAAFSPDDRKLLTSSQENSAKIWDTRSGNLLLELKGHTKAIMSAVFSPDGNEILTSSWDNTAKIWDANNGKIKHNLVGHKSWLNDGAYSPDGKLIVTVSLDSTAIIWERETGKLIRTLHGHKGWLRTAIFSKDGKKIITASFDNTAKIWDVESGNLLISLEGHTGQVTKAIFSPDEKRVLTISMDGTAKTWYSHNGKLQNTLGGNDVEILSATFSPDGKNILTASGDGSYIICDALTGDVVVRQFIFDNTEPLSLLPSGNYMCSKEAASLLYYIKGMKTIGFDQLDIKYNRPDKVLESLGNPDTTLIKSYRKAWEKRIKKLGIDTIQFRDGYSIPEADFVNRESIDYEQKSGSLRLQIRGFDSTYKLDRFNVWVNGSPVFGQRGIRIIGKNSNILDTAITVMLSQGENRIETSITNVNGTESYRAPLFINHVPKVVQPEMIRFMGIGIDRFSDSQYNLQYSGKDIRDLVLKLKEKYREGIIIDTLFNENVTKENVKALKQKLLKTTVNDKVVISFSGHGLLSKDYDYYLSTYPVNFSKPEEKGLPYEELENLLDSIPARKKLLLIDACHSGEVDKYETISIDKTADSLGLSRGITIRESKDNQQVGLKNSFELMQSLFVNVGQSTGATIISAAAGNQFALERGDLKNGVFTFSILEALNKYPTLKVSELKKIVGERVMQLTKGLQQPTSRNENVEVDWNVW